MINSFTVGIDDVLSDSDLLLYPNPSAGKITISIPELEHSISKIEIFDLLGRNAFSKECLNIGSSDMQIDLSCKMKNK